MSTPQEATMQQMMQQFVAYMQQQQIVQQQYQLQEQMRKARQAGPDCGIANSIGNNWPKFEKALKEEYLLEDSQCVTKQSFMKWIDQNNKGLFACKLLQEFEKEYEQLSSTEQRSTKLERVELFVQTVDARLQKNLVQLLEDATGDLGLTLDWKLVPKAVNMIVKCQMQVDKLIVADVSDTSDKENKDKSTSSKHKLEEPILDDLVKGIQELNLNLKAVKLEGLSKKGSTSKAR
ncbi:hypothetical protein L7F22_046409 [Adiantum nelumboides]|nr:hypothetical protein [Adiantum nelumboides]